jgi:hypothetical protein
MTGVSPEQVLFTDADGRPISLEDLIDDGLDGAYLDRVPALKVLLRDGTPRDQLYACMVLVAWGISEGFETLIAWASQPDSVPWAGLPLVLDRRNGVDASFEKLADAVRTSLQLDTTVDLEREQIAATGALLAIYDRTYFGTAMEVVASHPKIQAACAGLILAAAKAAIRRLAAPPEPFDLGWQAALLLTAVATTNDGEAAGLAEELLRVERDRARVARAVARSLGRGTGPATRGVLERLAASPLPDVAKDAVAALARQGRKVV